MTETRRWMLAIVLSLIAMSLPSSAGAVPPPGYFEFGPTWDKYDQPVLSGVVQRTWIWGPHIPSWWPGSLEPFNGGWRLVQYDEKTRMELSGGSDPLWAVANGLLAKEMITGQLQTGNATFRGYPAPQTPVVGDPDNMSSPTYAALQPVLGYQPIPAGWTIIQTIDHDGRVAADLRFSSFGVTAKNVGSPTNHTVASVFWDFMTSSGIVFDNPNYVEERLFPNAFYVTGYPITEAYWTRATVGGVVKDVLLQCFERRCLTYTPDNPDGWKVETGNIGLHYYHWRLGQLGYGGARTGPVTVSKVDGMLIFTDYPYEELGTPIDYFTLPLGGIITLKPGECFASEAWTYITQRLPQHDSVAIEGTGEGQWTAPYRIWIGGIDGEFFNETLVREGYAKVNPNHPDPLYQNRLLAAQQLAQQEGKGLWGTCQ